MAQLRIWLALLVVVAIALLGPNLALSRWSSLWDQLAQSEHGSDLRALAGLRESGDVDVVVMGSSVAAVNVATWMLERDTGRTALNIGVLAMPPIASTQYIDPVLALHPSTLVLVSGPLAFSDSSLPESSPFDLGISASAFGLRGLMRSDVLGAALGQASLLVRLRRVPRLAASGELIDTSLPPSDLSTLPPRRMAAVARTRAAQLDVSPTLPGKAASRAVRAFIRRAQEQGVEVILVAAPTHPAVFRSEEQYFWPPHLAELAVIAAESNVRVIGPDEQPTYTRQDFRDPTHLAKSGQRAFTGALIEVLR